jgi:2-iminobutanoate/2-iminopropanoate deaminase
MSTTIHSKEAPQFPLPFSHAVRAGDFVYVSGQVGVNPETRELVGDTVEEQTVQCLRNVETILKSCGLTLDHVIKTNAFLLDKSYIPAYNKAYAETMSQPYPARTSTTTDIAPYLIEIDVVAYTGSVRKAE